MHNTDEMRLFSERANKGLCSHAYIIDGVAGIGKLDFALFCARTMLCENANKPCGYCESCRKALSGNHPDIFIIGKEKTAMIADVRELIRRSGLKPNDGEKQIFIVCNAGKLHTGSQNALLKLFEEPPASVAIFLLTESRASLLPTVLSRGQRIHLDGRRDAELLRELKNKYPEISESELNNAVKTASGNLGEAENFLSKEKANLRIKAEKLLTLALNKENYQVTSMLLLPKFKREQLRELLMEFISLVVEVQKRKYGVKNAMVTMNAVYEKAGKRALAAMTEAAFSCVSALDNNANVTASASKFVIELLHAATK